MLEWDVLLKYRNFRNLGCCQHSVTVELVTVPSEEKMASSATGPESLEYDRAVPQLPRNRNDTRWVYIGGGYNASSGLTKGATCPMLPAVGRDVKNQSKEMRL